MSKAEVMAELPRLTRQEREEIRARIAELDAQADAIAVAAAVANPPLVTPADYRPKRAARSALWSDAEARWLEKLAARCGETKEGAAGQENRDNRPSLHGTSEA